MDKQTAFLTIENLLNAAVKAGLFNSAKDVQQVTAALELLRPKPDQSNQS